MKDKYILEGVLLDFEEDFPRYFIFGEHDDGRVDIATEHDDTVATVSKEHAYKLIEHRDIAFLRLCAMARAFDEAAPDAFRRFAKSCESEDDENHHLQD